MNATAPQPEIPDFTLLRLIGTGSYGDVWLACSVTGAFRAIKIVHRSRFDSDQSFEREFRGIHAFEPISRSHPNLLHILHVGRNPVAGFYFYVMELADDADGCPISDPAGYTPRTLRSVLRAGTVELSQAISIVQHIATGVAQLHKYALVHRDIKPSNIVFVSGVPKLGDIGLVARTRMDMSFVGTEGYIPPEGMGKPAADIYSLGKVLYELATSKDRMDFPELPSTPASTGQVNKTFQQLNEIILKACDPSPKKRFVSAETLAHVLQELSEKAERRAPNRSDAHKSRRRWMAAAVVVVVCSLLFMVWALTQSKHQEVHIPQAGESPFKAPKQIVDPASGAANSSSLGVKTAPSQSADTGHQYPATVVTDSEDASNPSLPTKTVTSDGAGEFLTP